ncbi:MAG TPA: hypothetical protein VNY52_03440, partial [Solirubrobacteraceae bacterium]|nr:hypothetical protein [Solirubrobacteraceae bacterium]
MIRRRDSERSVARRFGVLGAVMALAYLLIAGPAAADPSEEPFGIVPGSFRFAPSTDQAGVHSNWVTSFDFAQNTKGQTHNDLRTVVVNLPPGFVGNDTAVPTCTASQLLGNVPHTNAHPGGGLLAACPLASAVGTISFVIGGVKAVVPIYNMEVTSFGLTAELAFKYVAATTVLLISLRPGDSGLTITSPDVEKIGDIHDVTVTIWGLPASHEHDLERQQVCEEGLCFEELGGPQETHIPVKPFLTNPTSCGPLTATMEADSWEEPGATLPAGS